MLIISSAFQASSQNIWICRAGESSMFSETPLENISALDSKVAAALDISKNELAVKMTMIDFKFKNHLMEEHFNENYMESDKYPVGTFKGKIQEVIDYSKNGTYNVSAKGQLTMHGVSKERILNGKIFIENDKITITSDFLVPLKDHQIEVPTIVMAKIAEEISIKNKYVFVKK